MKKIVTAVIILAVLGLAVGIFAFFRPRTARDVIGEGKLVYVSCSQKTQKSGGYVRVKEFRDTEEDGREKCAAAEAFLRECVVVRILSSGKRISWDNAVTAWERENTADFVNIYLEQGILQVGNHRYYQIRDWDEEGFLQLLGLGLIR